jgi:hypothetical protein
MQRKKLAMVLMVMVLTLATALGAQAASFVLGGDYLQVGFSNSGGLIDDSFTAGINFSTAGNGSYSAADFLRPGSPFEFYSIGVNGVSLGSAGYLNGNTFGMTTFDVSSGTVKSSLSLSFGGVPSLLLIQTAYFDKTSKDINFTIEMQNIGSTTLTDVVYARGLDPDQDVYPFGVYSTNNSIAGGVVTAVGPYSNWSISITNIGALSGVPSISAAWQQDPYMLLNFPTNDGNGDYTINMAWNVGTLLPGHSAEVDFQYNMVPVPPSVLLLGSGLLGLVGLGWRRRKTN